MGGLNIAEKRLPQDGRIRVKLAGRDIDIRLSTTPTVYGERIVMRLLDKSTVLLDLVEIGMNTDQLAKMESLIHKSHGIVLVTGPTGSGKTTTLYAALSKINRPDLNIMTIEDPVEYQLKGISQTPVNPKIELTFANGLRSFLRQDPDVIMVGEIRDLETAEIAIQASLTGHLVFSTVHTNDAAGAVTRLVAWASSRSSSPRRSSASSPSVSSASSARTATRRTSPPRKSCARSVSPPSRSARPRAASSTGRSAATTATAAGTGAARASTRS
jgi:general secretion pathway protein E